MMQIGAVHFGGPDRPAGVLRDVLAQRIADVPAGGSIDWVTYYFRDRRLAADLIAARRRGVAVRVTLDGHPRAPRANDAVIALLRSELGDDLRAVRRAVDGTPVGRLLRPRLHEKLYCFSHPEPVALVGSFNPSGDEPERAPEVLREIGDHDRGHNLLVELREPALVEALVEHARRLHAARHTALDRFSAAANRSLFGGALTVHFWPRVRPDPIYAWLGRLTPGSRVRLAASHISGISSRRALCALAARGVAVEILSEATRRRVPSATQQALEAAGISFRRVICDPWLPMHNKFALVEGDRERWVIFGSFNWSEPSRRFNREIGILAGDARLFDILAERWQVLEADAV
jgi:phosphatidylserine/phosphatidylglycerophosphate/cardiolipin synthase-like enzyme